MMPAGRRHVVVAAAVSLLLTHGLFLAGCSAQSPAIGVEATSSVPGAIEPTATPAIAIDATAPGERPGALTAVDPGAVDPTADAPRALDPKAIESKSDDGPASTTLVREVTVGPARRECYGPFRRMCLMVDGQFFYDEIDGFTHEPGYRYRLRVERYDAFPGQKEPPQDAGRYGYRLVEVLSKTRVTGSVKEATVAPARVQCPKLDERCLLVDGQAIRNSIDGFQYEPGFEYLIRFERFETGARRLVEILSRTPVSGTRLEITVGPWRVGCYEDAPITAACIVVNGEPYYGTIEEFARRHGYEYRLRVERYDLFPDSPVAPPELPKYGYRLVEVLSEMPASGPPPGN